MFQVERSSYQKHLAIILDEKLNFKWHIDSAISRVNKGIFVLKETSTRFATEIISYNLQSFFKTSAWLWWYHGSSPTQF